MARRALLLSVLVLLAGCSAFVGETPTPTPEATPAPVPADAVRAPGLTADGVVDAARLGDAHAARLANESFALRASRTVRFENGTLRSRLELSVAIDRDAYLARAATSGPAAPVFLGRPPASGTYWSNGSVNVRALTRDGETTYAAFERPSGGAGSRGYWTATVPFGGGGATPASFYTALFSAVPVEVVGADDGVYRLVGTGLVAPPDAVTGEVETVSEVRLEATVTDAGLVRSLSLRYAGEVDGEVVTVTQRIAYSEVGETTVTRPAWFDRAVEN